MPWHALSIFLGCLRSIGELNRQWKIDCLDAHFVYPDGLAAVLLGRHLGIPVVVSARGTDINLYPLFRLIRPMIRWTLDHADRVIAVSAALRKTMIGLGTDGRKISVIPNGVDALRFGPLPQTEARGMLGLHSTVPIVVSVGSLIPSKGHQLVIRALSKLLRLQHRPQLYIIGEGYYRAALERLVRETGLLDFVHLVGKQPNDKIPLWFGAATVSCLASAREGWPNVITESLACGTPVVATRVGGIPEILHTEDLGILVETTEDSIAAGLERALTKNWNREAISVQTRARTWDQVAEELEGDLDAARHERDSKQSR